MANRVKPGIRIIFVNTGYLFPETHRVHGTTSSAVQSECLDVPHAERSDRLSASRGRRESSLAKRHQSLLCRQQERAVRARDEGTLPPKRGCAASAGTKPNSRAERKFIEWFERYNCHAISPLLNWSGPGSSAYLKKHDLPRHPLWEKGYASIGCNPLSCTRAVGEGEDPRSGRWAGQDKIECGINLDKNSLDSANL